MRNYHGFISSVLKTFRPNLILNTTLPQKVKNEPYVPSDDDIKRILAEASGTRFEIPIMLACFGLRRSVEGWRLENGPRYEECISPCSERKRTGDADARW